MRRFIWVTLLVVFLLSAVLMFGAYNYFVNVTLGTGIPGAPNWTQNGSLTTTHIGSGNFWIDGMTGQGALLGTGYSHDSNGNEVKLVYRRLPQAPQDQIFSAYFRATTDVTYDGSAGSYYAFRVDCDYWGPTLSYLKRESGVIWEITSVPAPVCTDNMTLRFVQRYESINNVIKAYVYWNGELLLSYEEWLGAGYPSGYYMGAGIESMTDAVLESISLGNPDTVPPSTISAGSVSKSPYANHVDLSWPAASDGSTGIHRYYIYRNGLLQSSTTSLSYSDTTVSPGITYNYELRPTDYHGNYSNTSFSVTTPAIQTGSGPYPSATPEGRRVGVRSTGAYWGAGTENIDVMSGNLNFSLPLIAASARGGMSAGFTLSYNSQNWRNDTGGNWKYGADVGYGFGWKLMAGSLTPVYSDPYTISHYFFLDSTGAEYRLDQNASGVWTSKESAYVYFVASQSRLYFTNGGFWEFNCVSASTEQDAGVMYPTRIQDSNGNYISVRYMTASGASWINSSARIKEIEDVLATDVGGGVYKTYSFTYNSDTPIPHLTAIANSIGTGQTFAITYLTNQALASPFDSQSFGNTHLLRRVTVSGDSTYHEMSYNGSGELTQVLLPYKGKLSWAYSTATYSNVLVTKFREVQYRYLWKDGTTSTTYTFSHEGSPGPAVHTYTQLNDPGGVGQKYWEFGQSGISMGLVTKYEGREVSGPVVKVRDEFTWVQDAAQKNSYIGTAVKTLDPGQSYVAQSKTTQIVDNSGNVTEVKKYNYGDLTNAYHTSNFAYLSTSPYTSRYILNRMLTGPGVTITYDQTAYVDPAALNGIRQWDDSIRYITQRGNATTVTPISGPPSYTYFNVAGMATMQTSNGISTTIISTDATNFTAPSQVTTADDFISTATYNSFLGLTNETGPNGTSVSMGYDSMARPDSTTTATGATVTYSYNTTSQPFHTRADVNGRFTRTYMDGLGRTIMTDAGYGNPGTVLSETDIEYDSCGCSPTGKVKRTSLPHAPGATKYWTTYVYDGIGRTLSVTTQGAETSGATTYVYEGNTVKVTDPAGKWKKYTTDVLGQLMQVNEPNPASGSDYVTTYTYNSWGQLTGVSMPRPTGTQTRSWTYNSSLQLTSTTNPENGTTSYGYNGEWLVSSKTDAKGQQVTFSYDSLHRLLTVRKYVGGTEQTCQREDRYWDEQSFASGYTQNSLGRLAAVEYYGGTCGGSNDLTFREIYSYSATGAPTKKRLRIVKGAYTRDLDSTYTYDNEGKLLATTYPSSGPTMTNEYDVMGRLQKLKEGSTYRITNATYNAAGQLTAMTGGTGVPSESRTYNSIGQMTQLNVGSTVSIVYNYPSSQNNGKISSEQDLISGETVTYAYDALNRLQSATSSDNPGWGQSFGYDGFGNNTTQTVTQGTAPSLNVTYNAATNRRTTDCADANGNIGSASASCSEGYTYDVWNRISAVGTSAYSYSPSNQRVWRNTSATGSEITYYSAMGQKLRTFSLSSTLIAIPTGTFHYFGGKLIKNAGGYITPDRLGSNGKYFPYGNERPSATSNNKEKFATYYRDADTGLDYANNRYHQSGHGRFLTVDPFAGSASTSDPGSWNRYAYTEGDPINYNDPGGLIRLIPDDAIAVPAFPVATDGRLSCSSTDYEWTQAGLTISDAYMFSLTQCSNGPGPLYFFDPQGGGGAAAPLGLTLQERAPFALAAAISVASQKLDTPDCAALFGEPTMWDTLGRTPSGILEILRKRGSFDFSFDKAFPFYKGGITYFEPKYFFMLRYDWSASIKLDGLSLVLDPVELARTIIHETGHVLRELGWVGGAFDDRDSRSDEGGQDNNRRAIREKCL